MTNSRVSPLFIYELECKRNVDIRCSLPAASIPPPFLPLLKHFGQPSFFTFTWVFQVELIPVLVLKGGRPSRSGQSEHSTLLCHIPQTQPVFPKHRTFQDFSLSPLTKRHFLLLWEADKVECVPRDLGRHLAFVRAEPVSEGDVSEGRKAQRS